MVEDTGSELTLCDGMYGRMIANTGDVERTGWLGAGAVREVVEPGV